MCSNPHRTSWRSPGQIPRIPYGTRRRSLRANRLSSTDRRIPRGRNEGCGVKSSSILHGALGERTILSRAGHLRASVGSPFEVGAGVGKRLRDWERYDGRNGAVSVEFIIV